MACIQYVVIIYLSEQVRLVELDTEWVYSVYMTHTGNSQKSWTAYLFTKKQLILLNPSSMQTDHFCLKFYAANIIYLVYG